MNSVKMSTKEDNDEVSVDMGKQEQPVTTNLLADGDLQTGKESLDNQPEMTSDKLQTNSGLQAGGDLQTGEEPSDSQPEMTGGDIQKDHQGDQSTDTPLNQNDQTTVVNIEE